MPAAALEIQKFLKGFQTIEIAHSTLKSNFAIEVIEDCIRLEDGTVVPVWLYNYSYEKNSGHAKIEKEARGLILDSNHDIVSLSFSRFFNHTSSEASTLDWEGTNAEFKHDGTMLVLYSYKNQYFFQTRRRANADGTLPGNPNISHGMAARNFLKMRTPAGEDPFDIFRLHDKNDNYSWVFEYVGPDNHHVTPYETEDLILLAIFNKTSATEMTAAAVDQFAFQYNLSRPPYHYVKNMAGVERLLERMNCMEEGIVLADHKNHRVKVKSPSYIAINKAINTPPKELNPKVFAEMVLYGDDEIAIHFPRFKPILNLLEDLLNHMMDELQTIWIQNEGVSERKIFAENVNKHPSHVSHILFLAWDGIVEDMTDAIKYIKPKQLIDLAVKSCPKRFKKALEAAITAKTEEEKKND